jgi:hypothetical protein
MKRLYFADYEGSEGCQAIVANSIKEAKKYCYNNDFFKDIEWIEIKIKWKNNKNIDFNKLSEGIIEEPEELEYLLKIGVFYCLFYWDCPRCNNSETSVYYDNKIGFYCSNCEDEN